MRTTLCFLPALAALCLLCGSEWEFSITAVAADEPAAAGDPPPEKPGAGQNPADPPAAEPPQNPFPNAVQVPPGILEGGSEWLNTSQPLDLKDLKGKIVLLDFWTYCCINCMHVLPDLKYLEEKYPNQLVVIGVHSAKFENEKVSQSIRDAIVRYEIAHPVVNDSEMLIWRKFGTRAWPTLALVDPEGKYAGSQSGEGNRELFDTVIAKLVEYHRWKGTLDETPLAFQSEASKLQPTPLRYPGKIHADPAGKRLFISDSNHNRLVIAGFDGTVQAIVGSGQAGLKDGTFAECQFFRPQGTCLVGNTLYVADTENHVLRAVDLEQQTVSTLAGTGVQGTPGVMTSGPLRETPLNSPWSVCLAGETLYIAMAGPHQIWSHKPGSDLIGVFAGSGREDVINGKLLEAAFAQPSEICADAASQTLYLVDSEGSAIRRIAIPEGDVSTIAGTSELPRGQSLFAFGDVDDSGDKARFQHPLGIAVSDSVLFVADSYNHKIRRIDLDTSAVTTFLGKGQPGSATEPLELNEPGGLAIADGKLFIADTNNHRVVAVELATQKAMVLPLTDLKVPEPPRAAVRPEMSDAIAADVQQLKAGEKVRVLVTLTIPEGHKRNELAPATWEIFPDGEQNLIPGDALSVRDEASVTDAGVAEFEIPLTGMSGETNLYLRISFGYCTTEENSLCRLASANWKIPIRIGTEGSEDIRLTFPSPEP